MALERWRPFGGSIAQWEPFPDVSDIQQEMNWLFDSFFGRPGAPQTAEPMWMPPVDMYETRDDLHVAVEVPGIREKEVSVSITGDVLTVKGERKWDKELNDDGYHRRERGYGKFERIVALPVPVQADKVKAAYRDGVLEITLPKAEEVKPKEIKIDIL
jgi:HSP20 family protein